MSFNESGYIEESKFDGETNGFDKSFDDNSDDDESDVARLAAMENPEGEEEDSYKDDDNYCPIDS
jgi:hypothetical protein